MKFLLFVAVLAIGVLTVIVAMLNFPSPVPALQRLKNDINAIPTKVSKELKDSGSELEQSIRKWIDEAGVVNYTESKYVPADAESESVDTTVAAEIPADNLNKDTGAKNLR